MNLTLVKDIVTPCIALIGAGLSIYNACKAAQKDNIKIKVVPKHASSLPAGRDLLAFDVTNLSAFPITITEVGVFYHNSKKRGCIISPTMLDGGNFPRKLESRTSFSAYLDLADVSPAFLNNVKCAYVMTACGVTVKGNSGALKNIAAIATGVILRETQN